MLSIHISFHLELFCHLSCPIFVLGRSSLLLVVICIFRRSNAGLLHLQKVKDSWRVVNHRDIVPTVPRLMGYCHVAQPVYLAAGDLRNALVSGYSSALYACVCYEHNTPCFLSLPC